PSFWVQEAGVPRRTFPVFVQGTAPDASVDRLFQWARGPRDAPATPKRAIVVVPSERAAEAAWASLWSGPKDDPSAEMSILVLDPPRGNAESEPRLYAGVLPQREVLRLATGIVVGLFRRAAESDGPAQLDFGELLSLLRHRFGVDVHRSLGVDSDEDALFILYQLAQRDSYAPGDPGANLHMIVLKPTGPSARLPWFAA
ncbi:MAG: hypothetical protein L3K06_03830, partial [Thermoplasmata archaeon]|nr:hypothetical protein [Thermoplasmata archaeon]